MNLESQYILLQKHFQSGLGLLLSIPRRLSFFQTNRPVQLSFGGKGRKEGPKKEGKTGEALAVTPKKEEGEEGKIPRFFIPAT